MNTTDLNAKIDRLVANAKREGEFAGLMAVSSAMRFATKQGKAPLDVVEAVVLHLQSRLQVLGAEIDAERAAQPAGEGPAS